MARRFHRLHPYRRLSIGALLVVFLAGFYLISAQLVGWRTVGAGAPVNQAAQKLPCAAADAGYCSLMRRLVSAVEAGDFSQLLANQVATTVVCPSSAAGAYCSGAAAGVPLSLFPVYQTSQPKLLMRNDYIAFFRSYEARNGRFIYQLSKAGIQNPLVFANPRGAVSLELQLRQLPNGVWQFVWPITVR